MGPDLKQILACSSLVSNQKSIAVCAYTETLDKTMRMFQLDLSSSALPLVYSPYWHEGWNIPDESRLAYQTEVVVIPSTSDVIVGVPLPDDKDYATLLVVFGGNRSSYVISEARGLGSFKSMAFSEDSLSLFAVDEQPALWRFSSSTFRLHTVARYIHPMANSVWKVMAWTNARIVVGVEYSLNMWTQCSPCPAGTVTAPGDSTSGIRQRCLCGNGTYNNLVSFSTADQVENL